MTEPALRLARAESARFGIRVFRGEADAVDARTLAEALRRDHIDVAILRVSANALGSLHALREQGLDPIVADTIVRYEIDLPAGRPVDDEVRLIPASSDDASGLESLTRETFAGYLTHYHANPRFPARKILDGYAEWASSHVRDAAPGAAAWLVEWRGRIAGFSCYRIDETGVLAIGVLNGIVPAFRGRGIYRGMLRRMLHEFASGGATRFAIATQVQNIPVQRIWAAEGFRLERAQNTVHVNMPADGVRPASDPL